MLLKSLVFSMVLVLLPATVYAEQNGYTAEDERLQAYIDGVIESTMSEHNIVGLTLSVVSNGKISVLKGYGYADGKSRTLVDPKVHLFRIGSASKTFTFTAMVQLVEKGKIDLNADVNDYLTAFKI